MCDAGILDPDRQPQYFHMELDGDSSSVSKPKALIRPGGSTDSGAYLFFQRRRVGSHWFGIPWEL